MAARLNRALGRPLRVLHVGNIANNAYQNARLLNRIGIESDVICHDYYHCMGCPEWEDADFDGGFGDQFRPDWTKVDLRGFSRPEWFAQGPRSICIAYLIARRRQWHKRAKRMRQWLEYAGRLRRPPKFPSSESLLARELGADTPPWWLKPIGTEPGNSDAVRMPALGKRILMQTWARLGRAAVFIRTLMSIPRRFWASTKLIYNWVAARLEPPSRQELPKPVQGFDRDVVAEFHAEFPQRPPLDEVDLAAFKAIINEWRELFTEYDVVLAYSTDPVLPLLAGVPYLALEHGTLREIPYQNSVIGRLTALAYRRAEHVFVTNSDCLDSARWLAGERVTLVNHPHDDKHAASVKGVSQCRLALRARLDADFLIFFPTRHDWVSGTGFADKANDVLLRVFGRLRGEGHRVGMICCKWGRNVGESRNLLALLGCAANVEWVEPMGIVKFERTAMACEIVADQFKLGAFGGVTFKALAAGVPVMTHLDPAFFPAGFPMPPVVSCQREDDVHRALLGLIRDESALNALGRRSRDWVDRYHNADTLLSLEIAHFARMAGVDLGDLAATRTPDSSLKSLGS
jgi:hypothetical protein